MTIPIAPSTRSQHTHCSTLHVYTVPHLHMTHVVRPSAAQNCLLILYQARQFVIITTPTCIQYECALYSRHHAFFSAATLQLAHPRPLCRSFGVSSGKLLGTDKQQVHAHRALGINIYIIFTMMGSIGYSTVYTHLQSFTRTHYIIHSGPPPRRSCQALGLGAPALFAHGQWRAHSGPARGRLRAYSK